MRQTLNLMPKKNTPPGMHHIETILVCAECGSRMKIIRTHTDMVRKEKAREVVCAVCDRQTWAISGFRERAV